MSERAFLFLQGPSSPFFALIAAGLEAKGHPCHRINLCVGDRLFWRRPGAVDYRGRLDAWQGFVADFIDRHRITDMVLLGEQRDHHKLAIAAAKALGVRVTVTDFGYLRPDWIVLERDGMSAGSRFPRDPEAIRALAAEAPKADPTRRYRDSFRAMALAEMAYHFANHFLTRRFPHYTSFKRENPVLAYLGTGWRLLRGPWLRRHAEATVAAFRRDGRPYFVFPLQMENDFQIRAYSHYPDMTAAIAEVVASFAAGADADARLLIKVHPWDPGLKNWRRLIADLARRHGVDDRVRYIDGGDLDAILAGARGMVTVNSTAGIQALRRGLPVIALGQALYDIPGLCFQGGLDRFWSRGSPPDAALCDAWIDATAACLQIRGVYYRRPGLDAAVAEAVSRLDENRVGRIAPARRPGSEPGQEIRPPVAQGNDPAQQHPPDPP